MTGWPVDGGCNEPGGKYYVYVLRDDAVQSKTVSVPSNAASGVHSYTYDLADCLKTWASSAGAVTYGYDNAGNRTSAGARSFVYDARNRLSTGTDASYSWAARGTPVSQTVNGATTSYTTDAANRVTGVAGPGGTVTYGLDGLDRVRTRSLNGGDPLVSWYAGFDKGAYEEKTSSWSVLKATDRLPDGSVYFARDLQGTGPTGPVVRDIHGDATMWGYSASKVYDPFGAVIGTSGLPSTIGYQGDYTDPTTGDVNMGARWYNPSTATFRSRDSYAGKLQTPLSLNRYTYALNNPTRYWNPTGRESYELGAIDFGSFDLSGLAASYGVSGPAEAVSYETANPSPGVYNYVVNNSDGTSQISTIAPTGIAISGPGGGTDRSGNLSYTPDDAAAIAVVELIDQGYSGQAIANAVEDAQKAAGARPSSTAIVSAAEGQGRILALVAPIAVPVGAAVHAGVIFCTASGAATAGVGCAAAAAAVAGIVVVAGIAYFVRKQPAVARAIAGGVISISGAGWISGFFVTRAKTGGSYGDTKGGTIFGEDAEGHHLVAAPNTRQLMNKKIR
jgi:RHS repeat-associated protein